MSKSASEVLIFAQRDSAIDSESGHSKRFLFIQDSTKRHLSLSSVRDAGAARTDTHDTGNVTSPHKNARLRTVMYGGDKLFEEDLDEGP